MKAFQLHPFIIKINSLPQFLKRRFASHVLLFIVIAIASSCFSLLGYSSQHLFRVILLIQLINFTAIGILHTALLEKRHFFSSYSLRDRCYFSFVLSLMIYVVLLLFYFFVNAGLQRMALASCCAFLLPYMLFQSWHYFLLMPNNNSMIWKDYKQTLENTEIVYLSTLLIHLKLSRKDALVRHETFLINTPLHVELGKLFNSFLNVENKISTIDIECVDEHNVPYGWKFFVVSFGGLYMRALDPGKSLHDNSNIGRNAIILAKRVRLS